MSSINKYDNKYDVFADNQYYIDQYYIVFIVHSYFKTVLNNDLRC